LDRGSLFLKQTLIGCDGNIGGGDLARQPASAADELTGLAAGGIRGSDLGSGACFAAPAGERRGRFGGLPAVRLRPSMRALEIFFGALLGALVLSALDMVAYSEDPRNRARVAGCL